MKRIILASKSPRRKELLEEIFTEFEIIPSNYEEDMGLNMAALELAEFLAHGKAKEVAERVENAIVIGADTFVVLKDNLLGKPVNEEDAKKMLSDLSQQTHFVTTGVSIIDTVTGKILTRADKTNITFRKIHTKEIEEYIASGEPMDKAGAYAIQGKAGEFVSKVEGSKTNVIGLPIEMLKEMLEEFELN